MTASKPGGMIQSFDVQNVRRDFPILSSTVHNQPLVYLDNAATTQKPSRVIDAEAAYYRLTNANVHRGVHYLSETATTQYERTRELVRQYVGAAQTKEVIVTRGTTESINLVASCFGRKFLRSGDRVLISAMEHHSNIVPWQLICEQTGAQLTVVPITDRGEIDRDEYERLLNGPVKIVALTHCSNALGTVNPVKEMTAAAHRRGIPVLLDGAQAVAHGPVNVRDLDCDFYAFSGHKMFAPTGVGILYGRENLLNDLPPYQGGGDMIRSVSFERTTFNELPYKFEAGTPNIAGVIAMGAALEYLALIDWKAVHAHERNLRDAATRALEQVPGVRIIGTAPDKVAVISFVMEGVHPHDIGTILDQQGIAIRTGHHCAQPVMQRFGVPATARASFAFYNTIEEAASLGPALGVVRKVMGQ